MGYLIPLFCTEVPVLWVSMACLLAKKHLPLLSRSPRRYGQHPDVIADERLMCIVVELENEMWGSKDVKNALPAGAAQRSYFPSPNFRPSLG